MNERDLAWEGAARTICRYCLVDEGRDTDGMGTVIVGDYTVGYRFFDNGDFRVLIRRNNDPTLAIHLWQRESRYTFMRYGWGWERAIEGLDDEWEQVLLKVAEGCGQ